MLLYTIADPAVVLAGLDMTALDPDAGWGVAPGPATAWGSGAVPPPGTTETVSGDGYVAEVRRVGGPWAEVVRVVSSDPAVYLRPGLQPGRLVCAHCLGLGSTGTGCRTPEGQEPGPPRA